MDALNNRLLAEELLVRLNSHLCELAVRVHLPCGIAVAHLNLSTSQLKHSLDCVGLVLEVAHYVRAL